MTLSADHLHQLTQGSGIAEARVDRLGCSTAPTPAHARPVALNAAREQREGQP